jgi:hypothetical protein
VSQIHPPEAILLLHPPLTTTILEEVTGVQAAVEAESVLAAVVVVEPVAEDKIPAIPEQNRIHLK